VPIKMVRSSICWWDVRARRLRLKSIVGGGGG
jgi:hypothetical protein